MKKSIKLLLTTFLFCLIFLSCSNEIIDSNNLKFELPKCRSSEIIDDPIIYNITLETKTGFIVYEQETQSNIIQIENVPIGRYLLKIKGTDSLYKYTGQTYVSVRRGEQTAINITLTKSRLDGNQVAPIGAVLERITATPKSKAYIPYGNPMDITRFTIKEYYSEGTVITVNSNNYSKYEINPGTDTIINELKDIPVTITHKETGLTATSEIPCKFELAIPTVSLKDKGPFDVNSKQKLVLEATVKLSKEMPENSYEIKYEWLLWKNGNNYDVVGNTQKFTVPTINKGENIYKCKVSVVPKDPLHCLSAKTEASSESVKVTVK